MAFVENVEVEPLKSSLAVVESDYRLDGYYLAIVKEGILKGNVICVYSKEGKLFTNFKGSPISSTYCDVIISTRLDEVGIRI